MVLKFVGKRDINGNRKLMLMDTDAKQYAKASRSWLCVEEILEVPVKVLRKLEEDCKVAGYAEVENL